MHNDIEKERFRYSLNLSGHVRNDIYQISHQSGMTHISFMHNDIYNSSPFSHQSGMTHISFMHNDIYNEIDFGH